MELLLLGLLPLLAFGVFGSNDDNDDDDEPPVVIGNPEDEVLRDGDAGTSISGEAGDDLLLGAGGGDILEGGAGMDVLAGETGPDSLFGDADGDLLLGAWGQDELYGGAGPDLLIGGAGSDFLAGGDDDDVVFGSSGADTLLGGDGDDLVTGLDLQGDLTAEDFADLDTDDLEVELRDVLGDDLTDNDVNRVLTGVLNGSPTEGGLDFVYGGAGDDTVIGDDGDIMRGDEGVDIFVSLTRDGEEVTTILDFDPTVETLEVLVEGPADGTLTFRNDRFDDGLEVLLDGELVAYLEGVLSNQIVAGSLSLQSATG